jgi:uncharacterized paraquat-inducible protein A
VRIHCSNCHTVFESAETPTECPHCHAEAGLERQVATPLPVKLFGALLACVIVASLVGSVLGHL